MSAAHRRHRTDTVGRWVAAVVDRWLARRSRQFRAEGLPQLAVFGAEHVGRAVTVWGRYERDELDLLRQALVAEGELPAASPGGMQRCGLSSPTRAPARCCA